MGNEVKRMLAVDIGANSGRIIVGEYDGNSISYRDFFRFAHHSTEIQGEIYWDFLEIWRNVKEGIGKAIAEYEHIDSIGVDSFCPDFCCFDKSGKIRGLMKSYRNFLGGEVLKEVFAKVSPEEFWSTGNVLLDIGLLPQIVQLQKTDENCRTGKVQILPLANAINYLLCGNACTDFTQLSVSMLCNKDTKNWDPKLCSSFIEHPKILPKVEKCGVSIGTYAPNEGTAISVVNTGTHDTAVANMMLSLVEENAVYINTGTWTSVGVKMDEPVTSQIAREFGVNNYGLPDEKYILCKATMGMWFLQECKRCWEKSGRELSYPEISELAAKGETLEVPIDLQDVRFLNAYGTLPEEIEQELLLRTGKQEITIGDIARCIYDHITDSYRKLISQLEKVTGSSYDSIVLGGGAVRDRFFCEYVEERCGKKVVISSPEATALGNMIMQLKALEKEPLSASKCRQILMNSVID